ncbi:MAG: fibronectin type III domain-containing protein [Myxococcota bacterium]|nr:fibronectin type III domain-containing protein [Myxococcota bacterium]
MRRSYAAWGETPQVRVLALLVITCGVLTTPTGDARADIVGYELSKIEGVGSLSLESRFGTTLNASEHIINQEDCEKYQGEEARFTIRLDGYSSSYVYGVAYSKPGTSCPTEHANFESAVEGSCIVAGEHRDAELSNPEITFYVDLTFLTGGDCNATTDSTSAVTIVLEEPTLLDLQDHQIDFTIDLVPPSTPTISTVEAGDRRFTVTWEDESNDALAVTYSVYWDTQEISEDDLESPHVVPDIEGNAVSIEDDALVNGETYYVRVVAIDNAENRSGLSEQLTVEPVETLDAWELYLSEGGTDPGGHCFVATAAFGSPMAPAVSVLRRFRDQVLMTTSMGQGLVVAYYRWGPVAAEWISDRPMARSIARALLWPLVILALMLMAGPMGLVLLAGGLGSFGFWLSRRRATGGAR